MSRRIKRKNDPPANRTGPWTIVPIALQAAVADRLNAAVKHCREQGLYRMTRSRLIRIALARLDLQAVITEEPGVRR